MWATGEVMEVKEYREQLSLEQLAKIATASVGMRDDIKTMLKKRDETIAEIRTTRNVVSALREDLKQYVDRRFDKLEKEIALIKQKIGLT